MDLCIKFFVLFGWNLLELLSGNILWWVSSHFLFYYLEDNYSSSLVAFVSEAVETIAGYFTLPSLVFYYL